MNNLPNRNWTDTIGGRIASATVIAAEITPFNEFIRVAAGAAALQQGADPLLAAVAVGATAMVVEGSAAVVTADTLASEGGNKAIGWVNNRLHKVGADRFMKTNLPIEAGIAMAGGSAIVTAVKHRQDPERTRQQNRRYGLASAIGVTALSFAESWAIANGIKYPSPETIGLATAAVGMGAAGISWINRKLKGGEKPARETFVASTEHRTPHHLGLSEEDSLAALDNPEVIHLTTTDTEGNERKMPLLVPTKDLYWFNQGYLEKQLGTDRIYYYAHPDIDVEHDQAAKELIEQTVNAGGAILYDTVTMSTNVYGDINAVLNNDEHYARVKLGEKDNGGFLNQYTGTIMYKGQHKPEFRNSSRIFERYETAIAAGEVKVDEQNGASMMDSITGEDAEKLWSIYDAPFYQLGEKHPINPGFDRDGFMEVLKNPDVIKVINRRDGEITTLGMLVGDVKLCPWLDEEYYKANFHEAYDTKNLFIFTGIVTDKEHTGHSYSLALMNLLMEVSSLRDTSTEVAFECTDISYKYIPKSVQFGIWKSGKGKIRNLRLQDQLNYYALKRRELVEEASS